MDSECQDMYLTYLYAGKLEIFPSCVCESLVPVHWSVIAARVGAILPNTVHLTFKQDAYLVRNRNHSSEAFQECGV